MDIKAAEKVQKSIEVFCCYAREDQNFLEELKKHLMPITREGLITLWADTDINAGSKWEEEIHLHLNTASIVLLLVSPDFLASDYCYSIEMKRALERHQAKEAHVIPVILRPVDWHEAPFSTLQALPSGGKSITSWSGPHGRDAAFTNVAKGIRALVEKLQLLDLSFNKVSPGKEPIFYDQKQEKIIQSVPLNPLFSFSQPLTSPEEFYGREYERLQLLDRVRQKSCISLIGPLRIGKTWLLQYLLLVAKKDINTRFITRYMDATLLHPLTPNSFFTQAVELFTDSINFPIKDSERPFDKFLLLFEEIASKGFHALLCVDEFDAFLQLGQRDYHLFSVLRALITRGWLTLVTASIKPISQIESGVFQTVRSPFFGVFLTMHIGPFTAQEAEQFISTKGTQAGLTEQEQMYLLKCAQVEGQWYPFYLQLAGTILLEDKNFAAKKDPSYFKPNDPMYWQDFERRLKNQIFMVEGKTYKSFSVEESEITKQDVYEALNKLVFCQSGIEG